MRVRVCGPVRTGVVGCRKATGPASERVKHVVARSSRWRVKGVEGAGNTCVRVFDKGGSRGTDLTTGVGADWV